MTMVATVAAGILAVASVFAAGPADSTTEVPKESPWYSVSQDGTAEIHLYYAYSST